VVEFFVLEKYSSGEIFCGLLNDSGLLYWLFFDYVVFLIRSSSIPGIPGIKYIQTANLHFWAGMYVCLVWHIYDLHVLGRMT
jgi:hypothetical protein